MPVYGPNELIADAHEKKLCIGCDGYRRAAWRSHIREYYDDRCSCKSKCSADGSGGL